MNLIFPGLHHKNQSADISSEDIAGREGSDVSGCIIIETNSLMPAATLQRRQVRCRSCAAISCNTTAPAPGSSSTRADQLKRRDGIQMHELEEEEEERKKTRLNVVLLSTSLPCYRILHWLAFCAARRDKQPRRKSRLLTRCWASRSVSLCVASVRWRLSNQARSSEDEKAVRRFLRVHASPHGELHNSSSSSSQKQSSAQVPMT